MNKIGFKFIFSRKKWLFMMVFSLSIIIAFVTSIFTASEAIKESLKENAFSLYGEHTGMLVGTNESKENLQEKTLRVGEYRLIDTLVFDNDKKASIGWMDQDALEMGHIKLLHGMFPQKKNEVAIELAYLELIDNNWKLGEEKTIKIGNREENVRLVGIINNYSAQWSVPIELEKGISDLPNIFISEKTEQEQENTKNFLVKVGGTKTVAIKKMNEILNDYNKKGIVNEKLFNKGLIDYNTITTISIIFQCLTLLLSIFCISSLIFYYNIEQNRKMGVLKAIGASNKNLYRLFFYQCLIIFLLSLLAALPIQFLLHSIIINNSFDQGTLKFSNILYLVCVLVTWLVLVFTIMVFITIYSIRKSKSLSINEIFSRKMKSAGLYEVFTKKIKSFSLKQLTRQMLIYPKQFTFTVLILCFSILLITFSVFVKKESEGIWDTSQAYYLSSQEIYGFDTVENLNVLHRQGLTFSFRDVQNIEETPGILYVEKSPFMIDVHPLLDSNLVTPSIRQWINQYGSEKNTYKGQEIIPNVRYHVVDSKHLKLIYPYISYEDFKGKVILFLPNSQKSEVKSLQGEKLNLIKMFKSANGLETIQKELEIVDVIPAPLTAKVDSSISINYDEINIVIDSETAINSELFKGYNELAIYTKENLSATDYSKISNYIHQLSATIPGSLFQDIPKFIEEYTKISKFVGILGLLSFIIAIVLSIISIITIVFSKYNLDKRNWGIYLSLGFSKNKVIRFLRLEMLIYLAVSMIISLLIFSIVMISINHVYPFSFYLRYYLLANLSILLLILIGSSILDKLIKKQSIQSILKQSD